MLETTNLGLPLVQASQAQKHVTVNEALALLDGLAQLRLASRSRTAPPPQAADGTVYALPAQPTGVWAGQGGRLAVASNGGWRFVAPKAGWRGWDAETGEAVLHDGAAWVAASVAVSPSGAASVMEVRELDLSLAAGASMVAAGAIPAGCVVFGVSGIVTEALTGALTGWRLGVPGGPDQYGSGLGLALGSWVQGLTGQPQAFYSETPLVLEAEGGAFSTGRVRLAVHLFRMTLPRP